MIERKREFPKSNDPTYQSVLADFLKAVPINRPLCDSKDKRKIQERAIVFGQIFNAFLIILRGYGNLVRWEEKKMSFCEFRS